MSYPEILFRGRYIVKEQQREHKNALIAASFTAWQTLGLHIEKPPAFAKYLKDLGLADEEPKATKKDLEREADAALSKAAAIIKAAGGDFDAGRTI